MLSEFSVPLHLCLLLQCPSENDVKSNKGDFKAFYKRKRREMSKCETGSSLMFIKVCLLYGFSHLLHMGNIPSVLLVECLNDF